MCANGRAPRPPHCREPSCRRRSSSRSLCPSKPSMRSPRARSRSDTVTRRPCICGGLADRSRRHALCSSRSWSTTPVSTSPNTAPKLKRTASQTLNPSRLREWMPRDSACSTSSPGWSTGTTSATRHSSTRCAPRSAGPRATTRLPSSTRSQAVGPFRSRRNASAWNRTPVT